MTKPQPAYDYRRYIFLVQLLAEYSEWIERHYALQQMIRDWQVPVPWDWPPLQLVPTDDMITLLAQFIASPESKNAPTPVLPDERVNAIWERFQQEAMHSWDG